MRKFRMLAALLCVAVFMCGFTMTAYAKAEDAPEVTENHDPVEETTEATEPDAGFTEDGTFVTRDLLYDEHTNKQFITVQTSGGNTFYIIIDYDKPVDEDGEQYQTYFLSVVDEADLLAAAEAAGIELPTCECTEKCMAGAINTDCPVCATNMTECVGVVPEVEPTADPEPVDDPEPEQPKVESNNTGTIILIVAVALIGGAGAWYFKIYRPKKQAAQPEEEYEEPDYYWGHYHTEEAAAVKDFAARSADYQRRYGVQEVKRPIAEQMKAAKEQTEKPVDKVREMPPKAKSREREER